MTDYIHTDGTIKTVEQVRKDNPNTSFPAIISQEILNELGYSPILYTAQPAASSVTKVVVRDGVEKNSNGDWVEKWKEVDRHSDYTDEDGNTVTKASQDKAYQDTLDEQQKENLRIDREPLLEEADWQIHKLEDAGGDASKWKTYRQALRDITKASDIYNVTWPTKPS